jgi:hypothetical protein
LFSALKRYFLSVSARSKGCFPPSGHTSPYAAAG